MKEGSSLRNQLKAIRTRLGLSQQELAASACIARQTIGGIEAELYAPSAAVALRLAKALGCRVEEIFWLEEEPIILEAHPIDLSLSNRSLHAQASENRTEADWRSRVTLAKVGGRWIAYPLQGEAAFRSEMVSADGVGEWQAGKNTVTVSLLDEKETLARTVVIAGCTPALSLWARSSERWFPGLRVHWMHANSTVALQMLARGEVHAAGLHLYDPVTGEYNAPFVRQALPGRTVALINLGSWEEGLLVPPGNPRSLLCVSDLAQTGVVIVNREEGAGSRLLLDTLLKEERVPVDTVQGYQNLVFSHQEVAAAVSAGRAAAGVSTAAVARTYGLDFVPLRQVRYDLAFLDEYVAQEPIRQLLSTLQHRWVRTQLSLLGGYDTTLTGEMTLVSSSQKDAADLGEAVNRTGV